MSDLPRLSLNEALIEVLAFVDTMPMDERVSEVRVGQYAASIGGGFYWVVRSSKEYGSGANHGADSVDSRRRHKVHLLNEWTTNTPDRDVAPEEGS